MEISANVNGTFKIILIKISVGAIVIQGLIMEMLIVTGTLDIHSKHDYSGDERAERGLCFAILIEYCIMSMLLYCAFAAEITPHELATDAEDPQSLHSKPDISWGEYVAAVFRICDVFDNLTPSTDGSALSDRFLGPSEVVIPRDIL